MKNQIYISLVALFAFYSCTEIIPLDLNDGDNVRLVVDAWITDVDTNQYVKLTETTNYFNPEDEPLVTGESVTLSKPGATYNLTEKEPGKYFLPDDFESNEGEEFTLSVTYKGSTHTASSRVNRVPEIVDVGSELVIINTPNDQDRYVSVWMSVDELPGVGDFYAWQVFSLEQGPKFHLDDGGVVNDEGIDGVKVEEVELTDRSEEEIGDTMVVRFSSITKEAHDYVNAVLIETDFRGGLFETPPSNIPTNISGDAMGLFVMSKVSELKFVLEE